MPVTSPYLSCRIKHPQPDPTHYRVTLQLTCSGDQTIENAELFFSLAQTLNADEIIGATLLGRDGDLHRLALPPLIPGRPAELHLQSARRVLRKLTDCPYGLFVQTSNGQTLAVETQAAPLNWDLQPPQVAEPECQTSLIPAPESLSLLDEPTFVRPLVLSWQSEGWPEPLHLDRWTKLIRRFTGSELSPHPSVQAGWPLHLQQSDHLAPGSYQLRIEASGGHLQANDPEGLHAGLSTLTQWLGGRHVQPVLIKDQPRFGYRGLHIDVARHFVPMDELRDLLDLCALYRINRLHWHLTDDEGWRLEIRALPALTQAGSLRGPGLMLPPQMGTGAVDHGGYYTQAQVRSFVAEARSLGLQVIPEIDLPGHARAMMKALPELHDPADESEYLSVQSYDDNTLNPGVKGTLECLQAILSEVVELFPQGPIHLGSDEVPPGVWQDSPAARSLAAKLGLDTVDQLHGWLLGELEQWLWQTHGRRISGWEEITADDVVGPDTSVYAWQGVEAGLQAARQGYQVVMTPAQHCYLDLAWDDSFHEPGYYWAGEVDLAKAYQYEPTAGWETEDQTVRDRIKGLQACLWSELLDSPDRRTYMLLPRLPAIAERAWSRKECSDLADFRQRCMDHRWFWQRAGWHYRTPWLGW